METLAALFGSSTPLAAQLVLKHPALAAISPATTITRAKGLSSAAGVSMTGAGQLIAKAPFVLALSPGDLGKGGVAEVLLDMAASYEWFTASWLAAAAQRGNTRRVSTFSGLATQQG